MRATLCHQTAISETFSLWNNKIHVEKRIDKINWVNFTPKRPSFTFLHVEYYEYIAVTYQLRFI